MEEFTKYKKIYQLGNKENKDIFKDKGDWIYIQEKVDGANFRFYITDEGQIVFGSRSQQLTSNEGEDTNVQKNFMRCVNHVRGCLGDKDLSGYKGCIFYGECMTKHTIGYDWENTPPFLGFDIFDTIRDCFVSVEGMYGTYHNLELDVDNSFSTESIPDVNSIFNLTSPIPFSLDNSIIPPLMILCLAPIISSVN